MSVSHRYKDFGGSQKKSKPAQDHRDEAALEEQKLQSFEAGYQAGWDDATKAQSDDRSRISAEFSQNLQDISFTYHEALTKLSSAFEPVLSEIIEKLLPRIGQDTLGLHVIEQVGAIMEDSLERPVEIVVSSGNEDKIREISQNALKEPFTIVCDDTLCDEEVFVRVGNAEKQIDLNAVIGAVKEATAAFFHEIGDQTKNG